MLSFVTESVQVRLCMRSTLPSDCLLSVVYLYFQENVFQVLVYADNCHLIAQSLHLWLGRKHCSSDSQEICNDFLSYILVLSAAYVISLIILPCSVENCSVVECWQCKLLELMSEVTVLWVCWPRIPFRIEVTPLTVTRGCIPPVRLDRLVWLRNRWAEAPLVEMMQ